MGKEKFSFIYVWKYGKKQKRKFFFFWVILSLFGLQKRAAGLPYTFLSVYTHIEWLREGRPRWITFATFFSYQPNSGNPTNPFISFSFLFILLIPNVHNIYPNKANFFELTIKTLNSRSIIYIFKNLRQISYSVAAPRYAQDVPRNTQP